MMQTHEKEVESLCLILIKSISSIRRPEMRQRVEHLVFDLLDESATGNIQEELLILSRLARFLRFGIMIYELEPMNGRHVLEEIEKFRQLISVTVQFGNEFGNGGNRLPLSMPISAKPQFDAAPHKAAKAKQRSNMAKENPLAEAEKNIENTRIQEPIDENGDNAAIRQSAIMEKIRQSGNKRIFSKDIFAAFPEISHRTLRYDLQKLCRQGSIVRIGEGGPNTAYELRTL